MKFSVVRRDRGHGSRYWSISYDNGRYAFFISPGGIQDLLGLETNEILRITRSYYGYQYDGEPTILFAQQHQAEKFMNEYLVPRRMMKEMSGNAADN